MKLFFKKLSKISHECKVVSYSWYDPKDNLQGKFPRMPHGVALMGQAPGLGAC